jgi:Na+/H+ antiporter NhaC
MKCPNCGEIIDEFTEICPSCKINLDEYEENDTEEIDSKTKLLKAINFIQFVTCIILSIIYFSKKETILGIICILIGIILFAFIKGFYNIVDLLDDINKKLEK